MRLSVVLALALVLAAAPEIAFAQADEIQVYDGGLAAPGVFNLTLHNNFTPKGIKDPAFSEKMAMADALVIVTPEYNHSFPGLLKHILDSCLKEYIHKAAGIVGVSAGPFGGVRAIQDFLPVIRELGLVNIFWDVNFGNVSKVFDESGKLLDEAFVARAEKFLNELIWMAKTLRYGRDKIALES